MRMKHGILKLIIAALVACSCCGLACLTGLQPSLPPETTTTPLEMQAPVSTDSSFPTLAEMQRSLDWDYLTWTHDSISSFTDGVEWGVEYSQVDPLETAFYQYGEPVVIEVEFRTWGEYIIAEYPPKLKISDENGVVVRTIAAGHEYVVAKTGPPLQCQYIWDQKDDSGVQVPYGTYRLVISDPWSGGEKVTVRSVNVSAWHGALPNILIFPSSGSLNRVVPVHQTQEAGGWNITIDYLVFSNTQSYLYGSLIPIAQGEDKIYFEFGYLLNEEDKQHSLYVVCGGPFDYPARGFTTRFNPIPKDTKSISFAVTLMRTSHYEYTDCNFKFDIPIS